MKEFWLVMTYEKKNVFLYTFEEEEEILIVCHSISNHIGHKNIIDKILTCNIRMRQGIKKLDLVYNELKMSTLC